jgi:CHAT domain-containing protein/Tfp pilus assembly protein PilF
VTTSCCIGLSTFLIVALAAGPAKDNGAEGAPGNKPEVDSPETPQAKEAARLIAEGERYASAGEFKKAAEAFEKAVAVASTKGSSRELLEALNGAGECQMNLREWDKARATFVAALATTEKEYGKKHWKSGDARRAVEDVAMWERLSPKDAARFQAARALAHEAYVLHSQGKVKEAVAKQREVVAIDRKTLGENHRHYAMSLSNLATMLQDEGGFRSAEPLHRQSLETRRRALGEAHPHFATGLANLAILYFKQGNYAAAETHFRQALEVVRTSLGEKDPSVATILTNLGAIYHVRGDHAKAERMFAQALNARRRSGGEADPQLAVSLRSLAQLYSARRDHAKADPLFREAVELHRKSLGDAHPEFARSLCDFAAHLRDQGDYAKAEPLFRQALEASRKSQREAHPEHATILDNLAQLHLARSEYAKAEPFLREALDARQKSLGATHPDYALSLDSLAKLHVARGDLAKAESIFRETMEVRRKVLGEYHPYYAQSLSNLASVRKDSGDYSKADQLYREAISILRGFCESAFVVQDEASKLPQVAALRFALDNRLCLGPAAPGVQSTTAYGDVLIWKGLVTFQQRQARMASALGVDPEAAQLLAEVEEASRHLARLASAAPDPKQPALLPAKLKEASERRDRIEADLATKTKAFRRLRAEKTLSPDELKRLLPEETVLVDFFEPHPGRKEARLLAFLTDSKSVRGVDLGETAPIAQAIDRFRRTLETRGSPIVGNDDPAKVLHERLWTPLAPHVKGARHLIVSPDGSLTRLPFAALPIAEDKYLLEEFKVTVLPVPRMLPDLLAPLEKKIEAPPSLLAVGNVDFNADPSGSPSSGAQRSPLVTAAASSQAVPLRRGAQGTDGQKWSPLPGAAREAEAVAALFRSAAPTGKLATLAGPRATADAVRREATKRRYLHLATHGFFADPKFKSALAAKENKSGLMESASFRPVGLHPGLLSGLVFAGANKPATDDDGMLTALEVGDLDLANVELAFLSACETGLGEVAGGEGVLGLQRAFQVAGARSTVTSLWKVDDIATELLVTHFYKNLWEKKLPKAEALREAQLRMLKEGRGAGAARGLDLSPKKLNALTNGRLPPHYWAAFVLSGDWR